jgi:hypothetical protein
MAQPFVEWQQLPRGTYRTTLDGREYDVWREGGAPWRWTVYNVECDRYENSGTAKSLDEACEAALACPIDADPRQGVR